MEPLWTVFSCCYFYRQDFIRYANAARRSWPGIQAAGRGMAWKKNNKIKVLGLKTTKLTCLKAGVHSYSTPCIFGSRLPALAKLNSLNYSAMEGKLNVWHIYWNMMCLSVSELRGVMERGRYSVGPRNVCVRGNIRWKLLNPAHTKGSAGLLQNLQQSAHPWPLGCPARSLLRWRDGESLLSLQ